MPELFETLSELSQIPGPSGYEDEPRHYVQEKATRVTDKVEVDSIGNLFVTVHGRSEGPTVMVASHMDEVGLIVKYVEENGFLRFEPLGSVDSRILLAQRLLVNAANSPSSTVSGTVGYRPPHILTADEANRTVPLSDLYIDIGAASREEVTQLGIGIGSIVTFEEPFRKMSDGRRVMGKAFDDRAGCTANLALIESFANERAKATIVFVFTVQEELGLRGAEVAANHVRPDLGIVLETTVAADVPDVRPRDYITSIAKGPTIRVLDSSMVAQRLMLEHVKRTAEKNNIPHQLQLSRTGGTDAGRIHLSGLGVPTGLISTPCRYLHGPSSVLSLADLENVVRLTEATLRGIESKKQFLYSGAT